MKEPDGKTYDFIGIRPVGNTAKRLRALVREAKRRGQRKGVSSFVNDCIAAHLPKLEEKYLAKEAA